MTTRPRKELTARDVRLQIRKMLLASPEFPRLYTDLVTSEAPNSPVARILDANREKNIGTNMSTYKKPGICIHIKVTGVRCGSPALRGKQFCYFHQRMLRTVPAPDSRLHHVALLEDEESIQAAIMEVINALIRKNIDLPRAELVLRALNTAVRNVQRVRFEDLHGIVREIPDFTDPDAPSPVEFQARALGRIPVSKSSASSGPPSEPAPISATEDSRVDTTAPIRKPAQPKPELRKPPLGIRQLPGKQIPPQTQPAATATATATGEIV